MARIISLTHNAIFAMQYLPEREFLSLYLLGNGDFVNFIGIVVLAGGTLACFLSIIPTLWRHNDKVYAVFALLEVIILCVAASALLGSGWH